MRSGEPTATAAMPKRPALYPPTPGTQQVNGWASASRWVVLLAIVTTISWRPQVFYSGGVDSVVLMKAVIGLLAVGLAWLAWVQRVRDRPVGTAYLWCTAAFLVASSFGAWTLGDLTVAGVLTLRVALLAVTVGLLVKTFPVEQLLRDLLVVCGLTGVLGAVTGLPEYLAGERLGGGIPAVHPNELAFLCALPVIGLVYLVVQGTARVPHVLGLFALLGVVWATGSRTTLMAIVVAAMIMFVQARRLKRHVAVALASTLPVTAYVMVATDLFVEFFTRGNLENISTLNSRSIGWAAAFDYPATEWNRWLGSGLSVKMMPVQGQYWDMQGLDSSWVSAVVHAGWIGAGLLAIWVVTVAVRSFWLPRDLRLLVQAVLGYLIIRSVLENGLLDSTGTFVAFLLISLVVDRRPSRSLGASEDFRGSATPRVVRG